MGWLIHVKEEKKFIQDEFFELDFISLVRIFE